MAGHEEIELALIKLWRATGRERYLELAQYFVDVRGDATRRKLFGLRVHHGDFVNAFIAHRCGEVKQSERGIVPTTALDLLRQD